MKHIEGRDESEDRRGIWEINDGEEDERRRGESTERGESKGKYGEVRGGVA